MVEHPEAIASLCAVCAIMVVAVTERLQRRRVERLGCLLFNEASRPTTLVRIAPAGRVVCVGGCVWGLVILTLVPPMVGEVQPDPDASKHVLICLDASPSMFLEDAGPQFSTTDNPQQRMVRAGEVLRGILDRVDAEKTRVTVFAVYTRAVPILEETFDKSVVSNLFDGLPIFAAFEQGETKLSSSVSDAVEYARRWPESSTLLLIVSDGDSRDTTPIRAVPNSIAETLVIGVGKTSAATTIAGHPSKQDAGSLRSLAEQLRGTYFDANTQHLPTQLLDRLAVVQPRIGEGVRIRDFSLALVLVTSLILAGLVPALDLFGISRVAERDGNHGGPTLHQTQVPLVGRGVQGGSR
ncbi:MAG: hypothetical protein L7U72_15050 [Rubripirellula sp.]|nr:hypothetical protein [Rubripirellula sp.]